MKEYHNFNPQLHQHNFSEKELLDMALENELIFLNGKREIAIRKGRFGEIAQLDAEITLCKAQGIEEGGEKRDF